MSDQVSIPDWFDDERVQAHLALGPARYDSALNIRANELVRLLGTALYTRHVKTDWRPPVWERGVGRVSADVSSERAMQAVRDVIDDARSKNIRVGAYYWNAGDGNAEFPDDVLFAGHRAKQSLPDFRVLAKSWLCRSAAGEVIAAGAGQHHRGLHADLTSGFREHVAADLRVAADIGFSSIFFDERHFPDHRRSPCYGSSLENEFRALGGNDTDVRDWPSSERWKFVSFQARRMVDVFRYWKSEVNRGRESYVPFVISGTYLSTLAFPHMSLALGEVADSIKTEYDHGQRVSLLPGGASHARNMGDSGRVAKSLAWIIARDAADGRPPYVWARQLKDLREARAFVADVILHGGIAAPHVADAIIDGIGERTMPEASVESQLAAGTTLDVLQEVFGYGAELNRYYRSSRPAEGISLLIDEDALSGAETPEERMDILVLPLRRYAEALSASGVAYRIMTRVQLETRSGSARRSIVPIGPISDSTRSSLQAIARSGANVVLSDPSDEDLRNGVTASADSEGRTIERLISRSPPDLRVQCGDGTLLDTGALTTFTESAIPNRVLVGILPPGRGPLRDCVLISQAEPGHVEILGSSRTVEPDRDESRGWISKVGTVSDATVLSIDF